MTSKPTPHQPREIAHTAHDAPDPDAMDAIKAMMADEDVISRPQSAAPAAPQTKAHSLPPISDPIITDAEFVPVKPKFPARGMMTRMTGPLMGRIKGYRPERRHIVLAIVVVISLVRPWWVISAIVLSIVAVIAAFLFLGYEGFWHKAMGYARWYARRRPEHAADMHEKLDAFALQWDAFLDRFPEGWVDSLYLPDFGEMAQADARHDAALDRRLHEMQNDAG